MNESRFDIDDEIVAELGSWFQKLIHLIAKKRRGMAIDRKIIKSCKSARQCEIRTMKYILGSRFSLKNTFSKVLRERKRKIDSSRNAKNLREKGNVILRMNKDFDLSAKFYTEALFAADGNSEETALAHANRAYVLMQMGKFKEAYDDCECCLTGNYPQSKINKINLRQADCAINLGDIEKINRCLDKFQEKNIKDLTREELTVILKLKEKLETAQGAAKQELPKDFKEKKQTMCFLPQKGRYVVAGEPIKKHEIIMKEEAFAFVPIFPDILYICQGCTETDIVPFPCYHCRNVSYCSIKCREDHAIIHKIECKGYKKDIFPEVGVSYLALRTLLVGFPEMLQHLSKTPQSPEQIWDEILAFSDKDHNKYCEIIRLSTNFDKMDVEDYLRYAIVASFLTVYLQEYSTFFGSIKSEIKYHNYTNWELVVSSLLLRHIAQMVTNAHSITGFTLNEGAQFLKNKYIPKAGLLHSFENKEIFSAIYPRVSLYNHSCEPSFSNRFNKSSLTIIADKDIPEGEEIFNCYGVHFKQASKVNRRDVLRAQYHFECDCKHCTGDDEEFKKYVTYRCTNADCKKLFTTNSKTLFTQTFREMWKEDRLIKCPHCKHNFYNRWLDIFEAIVFGEENLVYEAYDIYKTAHLYVEGPHKIKETMCWLMLREWSHLYYSSAVNSYLLDVANDLLLLIEERFGIHSMDFIEASARYMDLLACGAYKPAAFNTKPIRKYNLGKIQSSFEILPDEIQKTFKDYFNRYISK